jgi:hypothetical protein
LVTNLAFFCNKNGASKHGLAVNLVAGIFMLHAFKILDLIRCFWYGFPIAAIGFDGALSLSAAKMTHPRPLSAAQRGEQLGCSGKRRRSKGRLDLMDND